MTAVWHATFDRVGRNHDGAFNVECDLVDDPETSMGDLAAAVLRQARRFLLSREVRVLVTGSAEAVGGQDEFTVRIYAGARPAGTGRLTRHPEAAT